MFDDFFAKALELRERDTPFVTATVVRAEAPASAKPGDKAIVTADGVMYGWIGGSCAQPTVIEAAMEALGDGRSRLIQLAPESSTSTGQRTEGLEKRPMTCYSGGTLEIYVEPQRPQARLLIVGHLPVAQALAHLGKAMSYRVIAVDPSGGTAMSHADEVVGDLGAVAGRCHAHTYVVVASHGHFDEPALEQALASEAPYVGLVASRKRAGAIRRDLSERGLGDGQTARLKAPAGLDVGAQRGDEIALSIMAEIVEYRRRAEPAPGRRAEPARSAVDSAPAASPSSAERDPVCGMRVDPSSPHRLEHDGRSYAFCCAGCQSRFSQAPGRYLSPDPKPA